MALDGLSEKTLRRLHDAVDPAAHDGTGTFVPTTSLAAVGELIGCDDITFQVMDARKREVTGQTVTSLPTDDVAALADDADDDKSDDELVPLFWQDFWRNPCSYPQRSGDYSSVTRLSDFGGPTNRRLEGTDAYLEAAGIKHEVMMPMPPEGDKDRRLLLFRNDGRDFSDTDVVALTLLRPHLMALHLRQCRRAAGTPDLTPRQLQILTLVAAGCTSAQVGRALGLSETTVNKHLHNAFARLDVNSRPAAVARILPFTDAVAARAAQ